MRDPSPRLPPPLLEFLRPGAPVLLLTTDADGTPTSTYTWAIACDAQRLRFAVDHGGSSLANLARDGLASIVVIAGDAMNHLVKGHAQQRLPRLPSAAQANMALWELEVRSVFDQSWPGVETTALRYRWPRARAAAMRRMECAVYEAMRSAPSPE